MDLVGIQGRLQTLGVTLRFESDPANIANLLQSQRQYRAALYIDRLEATRAYLDNLNGPGGLPNYAFVAPALARGELLNQLAASLDEWICPPVEAAVNAAIAAGGPGAPTDYQTWFTARVFDPAIANFNQNVLAFFTQYPITAHALTQIQQNFQNNIETALRRMLPDRPQITLLFSDRYNNLALTGLSEITSTGSDFHKGGQQVLIFTFTTHYWHGFRNWREANSTLKLVYKPGDVEIDCLVAGESAAVNRATGVAFQVQSLAELFNDWIATHPAAGQEALPTYRILPRHPVSPYVGLPPYPVRQAYGYLEYLGSALTGLDWSAFNFYPNGESDYLIFQTSGWPRSSAGSTARPVSSWRSRWRSRSSTCTSRTSG